MSTTPLYKSTAPRLSNKLNEVTGEHDRQMAGLIKSINPTEMQSDKEGSKPYYLGTATIHAKGEDKDVSVIISASQITKVNVGDTKWLTVRVSEDGLVGFQCGGLDVTQSVSVDELDAIFADVPAVEIGG